MNAALALIDTNILVYTFDASSPKKRMAAKDLLARCWRKDVRYAISTQNLAEFATVVTEKVSLPLPAAIVREFIGTVVAFDGWQKLQYSGNTILQALTIQVEHHLHFWDALLIATMREQGIHTIYSEDGHLARVPGVTVINPFV